MNCTVAALTLDDLRNRIKEIDDPEQASGLRIFINHFPVPDPSVL